MRPARFARSDLLCEENTPPDRLHIIRSGLVQLFVSDPGATRSVIGHLRRLDTLGESALLATAPAPASAVALTQVETWTLTRSDFEDLVRARPEIGLSVMRTLGQRLERGAPALQVRDHARGPHVIALLATDRGLGRTTLAINLATRLAAADQGRVLLYDPSVACPDIARALGITSDADYTDALLRRETLDVEHSVWKTKGGFFTLLPPRARGQSLKELHLFVALHALCDRFDIVVTDSSSPLASLNNDIVSAASRIILLVRAGAPGLASAFRQFESVVLRPQGIDRERILIGMVAGPAPTPMGAALPPDVRTFQIEWAPVLMDRCREERDIAVLARPDGAYAAAVGEVARGLVYDQVLLFEVAAEKLPRGQRGEVARALACDLARYLSSVRVDETALEGGNITIGALATRRALSAHVNDLVTLLTDLRQRRALPLIRLSINGRPIRL